MSPRCRKLVNRVEYVSKYSTLCATVLPVKTIFLGVVFDLVHGLYVRN